MDRRRGTWLTLLGAGTLLGILGCGAGAGEAPVAAPTPSGGVLEVPTPSADPADFTDEIDNPYLPLSPGTRWVYRSTSSEGDERIVVTVTHRTREVQGVTTVVVHDVVRDEDGRLVEDTDDWYAQDLEGNVWYFGEDTTAFEDGQRSTEGSWEAGVDGAQAGVVMLADPRVGAAYQQEFYAGEAEDEAEVLALDATATVPFASYRDLVKTKDFTALEPAVEEHKYYARGVGFVYEEMVSGGDDRVSLVAMSNR